MSNLSKNILKITDLKVGVVTQDNNKDGMKEILKGFSLQINPGEVHVIMGTNGSGKSTLANVLCGKEGYEVMGGVVTFNGGDLLDMNPEERARAGLFMAFQYPVALPGVNGSYFLRTAVNSHRKHRGEVEYGVREFTELLNQKSAMLKLDPQLIKRSVNDGFSGGEKKRYEILQLALLEPKLAILDETDSGLDIDALQVVASGVNTMRDGKRSFLIITHYQRLLDYIKPDHVHVMIDGKIVRSGDFQLAHELESKGYSAFANG